MNGLESRPIDSAFLGRIMGFPGNSCLELVGMAIILRSSRPADGSALAAPLNADKAAGRNQGNTEAGGGTWYDVQPIPCLVRAGRDCDSRRRLGGKPRDSVQR